MSESGVIIKEVPGIQIEPEAIALRIQREGTMVTYVMPAARGAIGVPAKVTLPDAERYCRNALEVAELKMRAAPDSEIYRIEAGIFTGLVLLIERCQANPTIKAELRNMARDKQRADAERQGAEALLPPEAERAE